MRPARYGVAIPMKHPSCSIFFGRFNIHMQTCTGHFDEFKTLEEINDRISVRDVSKPVLYHHSMYVGG